MLGWGDAKRMLDEKIEIGPGIEAGTLYNVIQRQRFIPHQAFNVSKPLLDDGSLEGCSCCIGIQAGKITGVVVKMLGEFGKSDVVMDVFGNIGINLCNEKLLVFGCGRLLLAKDLGDETAQILKCTGYVGMGGGNIDQTQITK